MKSKKAARATLYFAINIRHLGAVLGNTGVKDQYIADKVQGWCKDIKMLADIAESEPQAAYSAYISGIQHR